MDQDKENKDQRDQNKKDIQKNLLKEVNGGDQTKMNKDAKNTNEVSKQKLDFSNCLAANEGDLQDELSR